MPLVLARAKALLQGQETRLECPPPVPFSLEFYPSYSIPTSADKEDHVSMGTIAARKARDTVKNVGQILATEPLCATQGLEFLLPLQPGRGMEGLSGRAKTSSTITGDPGFNEDMSKVHSQITSG